MFPVEASDQILLVSDGGQLIRVPVNGIRIAGRSTKGVTIFNTADGEKVVSVERISETETDDIEAETPLKVKLVSPDTTNGSEEDLELLDRAIKDRGDDDTHQSGMF